MAKASKTPPVHSQLTSLQQRGDTILDAQIEQLVQLCLRAYVPGNRTPTHLCPDRPSIFEAETSVKTMVGGDLSLLDAFFSASIRAGARGGDIYVATEGSDISMIRGMALWWGPGVEAFSTSVFLDFAIANIEILEQSLQRRPTTRIAFVYIEITAGSTRVAQHYREFICALALSMC
ncbi:hypothetical protein K438DRAFT_1804192 [Mycena galopus ATCC 62051]|nr:hypothetical protein K438DRAFT_1804192 [Mycena galopus ATCC 62051]